MNSWTKIRTERKLSIEDVYNATKIPKNTLRNLESRSVKNLHPNYISRLAKLYKIEYFELMREAGYETPSVSRSKMDELLQGFTREEKNTIKMFMYFIRNEQQIKSLYIDDKDPLNNIWKRTMG